METVNCILCGSGQRRPLFQKESRFGDTFTVNRCLGCGLEYVSPRPEEHEMARYYSGEYFTTRTERGYNNYFSEETAREIERVIALNLEDLDFYSYEKDLALRRSLDIGSAAGYFVRYLQARGWEACGIDVSRECVLFGREQGLDLVEGDYLGIEFERPFNLVTLWATIEHLHHPELFVEKIRSDLVPGGRLYLSTCRAGGVNFRDLHGKDWRYYNVPEHLFYFTKKNLFQLLQGRGFRVTGYSTYGSGTGRPGTLVRRGADWMAKHLSMGDMMLVAAERL
jgi:2-polyprenyl-3-methyl-5-hydroxy-6-metoxy-1,4-benzoquinol methylase